jgi:hypothetical protein
MKNNVRILPVSDAAEMAQRILELQPKNAVLVMVEDDYVTVRTTYLDDVVKTFGALEYAKLHIWSTN